MEIPYDLQIMARTVYGEARNQNFLGMVAIAEVILNRAKKPSWWGTDISSVCTKPWQFSCWNINDPNRGIILDATFEDLQLALAACFVALKNNEDITRGATHYHTVAAPKSVTIWPPNWANKLTKCAAVGSHVFYR